MERKATENDEKTFSYTLVSQTRKSAHYCRWSIIEKGSEKTNRYNQIQIDTNRCVSYDTIKLALSQIEEHIRKTPCVQTHLDDIVIFGMDFDKNFKIFVKEEFHQITNSVKARGVVYSLLQLSDAQKRKGVIAISATGSFAFSLCYFGRKFEIPVTVIMPKSSEIIDKCRDLGGRVLVHTDIAEALKEALRIAEERGLVYIDGNDHPDMIIGQSTLAIEIMSFVPIVDAIILPTAIDKCGLTRSLAMTIKQCNPNVKVIKIRPLQCDPLIDMIRKKTMIHSKDLDITTNAYRCLYQDDHDINLWIDKTVNVMNMNVNVIKFPDFTGTIGIAGILFHQLDELIGKRVMILALGKMDLSIEVKKNNLDLECGAGPSNQL